MSASVVTREPTCAQVNSPFFHAPAEIRDAIYAQLIDCRVHVFMRNDRPFVSPCVGPCDVNYRYDHSPRRDRLLEVKQARRLLSSWGPHWNCEEFALGTSEQQDGAGGIALATVLLVCKRMYMDVINLKSSTSVVEITDLNTLSYLTNDKITRSSQIFPNDLVQAITRNLTKLNLTIKLPLSVCEDLEATSTPVQSYDATNKVDIANNSLVTAWKQLDSTLAHFKSLRSLSLFLDHRGLSSWSVVHERMILSPFTRLATIPKLSISINLPKLHPKFEDPDRHFTRESPAPPFQIIRRSRQEDHGVLGSDGCLTVEAHPDFPILVGWVIPDEVEGGDVEEMERGMWLRGENPQEIIDDLRDGTTHSACGIY